MSRFLPIFAALVFLGVPHFARGSATGAAPAAPLAWKSPWRDLPELVVLLKTVPTGRRVLESAAARDPRYLERVKRGKASYTESTFSRTYSLLDGSERIELHHEITLSESLRLSEAVVDLAHELVHFTEKQALDPYRRGFAQEEFIRQGIEGEGGELSALGLECHVAWELAARYPAYPRHSLCAPYRGAKNEFLREKARQDYYALGKWFTEATPSLKKSFPEASSRMAVFTSSYAQKPYPIALAEEFETTRKAACANNRRKYRLIAAQADTGRAPSSDSLQRERMRLKAYERIHCQR